MAQITDQDNNILFEGEVNEMQLAYEYLTQPAHFLSERRGLKMKDLYALNSKYWNEKSKAAKSFKLIEFMTQQEIQERNKQIALMLWGEQTNPKNREPEWHIGYDLPYCDEDGYFKNIGAMNPITVPLMQFHSDWSWLMEAVDFVKKTSGISMVQGPFKKPTCVIHLSNLRALSGQSNTLKEAVFIAVSDFAKLYNEEKL